jgi:septal ring factor EnvC (AmiA/AmiB activator)
MLAAALKSAVLKLRKDATGGIASDQNDLQQLEMDNSSLQNDLNQYQSLQAANYGDPNYEVDYGTDEIPVWDALSRTRNDMTQNDLDRAATQADIEKLNTELHTIEAALTRFASLSL